MKRLLFFALFAIAVSACQKDVEPLSPGSSTSGTGGSGGTGAGGTGGGATGTPAASGTISASIEGNAVTFNTAAQAVRTAAGGMTSIIVVGFQGAAATSDQISIAITTTGTPAAGTYSYDDLTATNLGSIGFVKYGDPSPYASYLSSTNPSKVVVTSITATSIAGTFSGDVFQFTTTGGIGPKKSVTQGKFNVKIN